MGEQQQQPSAGLRAGAGRWTSRTSVTTRLLCNCTCLRLHLIYHECNPPSTPLPNPPLLLRSNLETVRLLLNASAGWKSMRMVRNEDAVVAGLVAAVQQWNAQSCLLRRFDRAVKAVGGAEGGVGGWGLG